MELFHVALSAMPEIIYNLSATSEQFLIDSNRQDKGNLEQGEAEISRQTPPLNA